MNKLRTISPGKTIFLFLLYTFLALKSFSQCAYDIYIANDQSGSVDALENMQSRQFIAQLATSLTLGNSNTESRIAVASWSSGNEFEQYNFPLDGAGYTTQLSDIINFRNSPRSYNGGTDPYTALLMAWQNINITLVAGRNVPKVIILMTDAYANQVNPGLVSLADQVKAAGIHIAVLGIDAASGNPPQNILQNVASPGLNFTASSYSSLINSAISTIQAINSVICPPALAFDLTVAINSFNCVTGQVNYTVNNLGNQLFGPATLSVSFYSGNPVTNTASLVATHRQPAVALAAGSSGIYNFSTALLTGVKSLYAVVNLDTAGTNAQAPLPYSLSAKLLIAGEYNSLNNFSSVYNASGCVQAVIDVHNTGIMGCNNTASYQVQVCNTGSADATIQSLTPLTPAGFSLMNTQLLKNPAGCNSITENIQRSWGTYFGGTGSDIVMDVATDASGNVYIAGYTASATNIATTGAFDNTFNGATDGFAAKFNSSGVLQWGTYIGGIGTDEVQRIAIDNSGNVYVSGYTMSLSGIASAGAFQTARSGSDDAFLVKLNGTNGTRLWGTYYGDPSNSANEFNALVTVSGTDVYFAMRTFTGSSNLTTNGSVHIGGDDILLAKFNSNGTRIWARLWGGTGHELIGFGEIIADASALYLGGSTYSTSGIATGNYWDNTSPGGRIAFLARFDPANGNTMWATYADNAGTSSDVTQIHIENGTNLVVSTVGSAAKLYRFSINGGAPLLSVPVTDGIHKMAVDASGIIYAVTPTTLTGLGITGAYQQANAGGRDLLLRIYSSSFTLRYASYYGDIANEIAIVSTAIDASGNIFLTGATATNPSTVLATTGAHQTASTGGNEGILAKFSAFTPRGVLPAGCCLLLNYFYDASTAVNGTHHSGFAVTATKSLASDADPAILPNTNFAVSGYVGTYNGFNGAASTTDDVIKTGTPCVVPASTVTTAISFAGSGLCNRSFGTATITITNPNTGISFSNARLLLNLTGTGAVFSGEPYNITNGLLVQSPDLSNTAYPSPGVSGQLNGYAGNQYLIIYSLSPGTSTFVIDVAMGTAVANLTATVLDLPTYYNPSGNSNTATGTGFASPGTVPSVNINCPGSVNAGSSVLISGTVTGAASVQWNSGTAGNMPNTGTLNSPQLNYTPTAMDMALGYAEIYLKAVSGAGCDNASVCRVIINNIVRDFGDAPISFDLGTMQQPVAAASTKLTGLYLGTVDPDMESTAQPSIACNGDGNDEDGLHYYPATIAGQSNLEFEVEITNNSNIQAYFIAYIDWNEDGDFLDINERSTNIITVPPSTGTAIYHPSFSIPFPTGPITTYMRLRLSSDADAIRIPYGASPEGEVEDHVVNLTVLPVDLINFKATASGKQVLLTWETTTETNNHHFDIERSEQGFGWQKIGTVNGQGNSSQLQAYGFTDYQPYGKSNHYRLKQVNSDGSFSYSAVRKINFESTATTIVYPNPMRDELHIASARNNINYDITITNISGREVLRKNKVTNESIIMVTHLPAGVYIVKLSDKDDQPKHYKIIKQ